MGKYNFSAMKFEELERRLEALEKANNELRKENARLKKNGFSARSLFKDISNSDKATQLFSIDIDKGNVIKSEKALDSRFKVFYQNIFRILSPCCYTDPKTGAERLQYTFFEQLSDEEYKIHVETLEAIIDLIYYAQIKLNKIKEDKNNE